MIKTPLDLRLRPDLLNRPNHRFFPVHRDKTRVQPLLFQPPKPRIDTRITLSAFVDMRDRFLSHRIYETNEATILMKIGPVEDKILETAIVKNLLWRMIQPVIFDPRDLRSAMPRDLAELSDRVAFTDPKTKPTSLFRPLSIRPFSDISSSASFTVKPLLLLMRFPKKIDVS